MQPTLEPWKPTLKTVERRPLNGGLLLEPEVEKTGMSPTAKRLLIGGGLGIATALMVALAVTTGMSPELAPAAPGGGAVVAGWLDGDEGWLVETHARGAEPGDALERVLARRLERSSAWTTDDGLRMLPVGRAAADVAEIRRATARLPTGKHVLRVTAKLPVGADGAYDCRAGLDAGGKAKADGFAIAPGETRSVVADAVDIGADGMDVSVASACRRTDGGPGVPPVAFAVEVSDADGSNVRVLKDGEVRRPADMPKVTDRRAATGVPQVGGWSAVQPGGLHAQATLAADGGAVAVSVRRAGDGDLTCVVKMTPQGGKPLVDALVPVPPGRAVVVSGDAPTGGKLTVAALDVSCDGAAEAVVLERPANAPLLTAVR